MAARRAGERCSRRAAFAVPTPLFASTVCLKLPPAAGGTRDLLCVSPARHCASRYRPSCAVIAVGTEPCFRAAVVERDRQRAGCCAAARAARHAMRDISKSWGDAMLGTILVILLILMLVGAAPRWGYSRSWGYGPSGIVGVLLIVVLVLALSGRM
jgi:hypothetical protein